MYRWIIAFDVEPEWVADGFSFSDAEAIDMLSDRLEFANVSTELRAKVIASPNPLRIAREQGFDPKHPQARAIVEGLVRTAPHKDALDHAIYNAIKLLESVAFVREEGDNTASVLQALRDQLTVIRGES